MVSLRQNEMTTLPKPMQILERQLLNRSSLHPQILHRKHLILRLIPLHRHLRQVILAHQIHHIGGQHRSPLVLHDIRRILDNRVGNVRQHRLLPRDIVHESRQLGIRVILRTKDIDTTSLEFFGVVNDAIDRLRHIVHPHRLCQGMPSIHEGHNGESLRHDGKPIEEHVLVSEHLRGTDDGGPGIGLQDRLLALVFGAGPLAGGVGVGGRAAHVDQIVHLHFRAELGDCFGNFDVCLGHARGHFVVQIGEFLSVLEGLGVVILSD
mmetsp:Transcript_2451/g.4580  ORF Transcript_2451/g.4580 Transcript_2451/m.4580 type:complete len:265 (+) Transcript_2451:377-1171(+)